MKKNYCYAVLLALCFVGQAQAMDVRIHETQVDKKQKNDHEQPEPDQSSSQSLGAEDRPADDVIHDAGGATIDPQQAEQIKQQLQARAKEREREKSISETARESFSELKALLASLSSTIKGVSSFCFSDDQAREAYFEELLEKLGNAFKDGHGISATELESLILTHAKRDLIVIDERDFCGKAVQEGRGSGARVINPYVNSLLQALRNIAQQAPTLEAGINQQIRRMANQHNKTPSAIQNSVNEAMAREIEALFKPLEDLVLHHNQSRVQEDQASKPVGWGWKGHLLTATVASAVTLGAVYAGLRFSNHKLVSATA